MAQSRIYNNLELEVFELVKTHIQNSEPFQKEEVKLRGGIFFKSKPKEVRLDLIEINSSGLCDNLFNGIIGHLNVNYQHDDVEVIEFKHPIILDVMDHAVIGDFLFSPVRNEIFRISKFLWWGNSFYEVIKIKEMQETVILDETEKKEIGMRFKEFRKSNNILQTDIEQGVPTTFVQISRIENGHRYPSTEILIYMAKTHNMDLNYILTGQSMVRGKAK